MAPFNKRQIGYIQAIAGRQQHTTLICKNLDTVLSSKINEQEGHNTTIDSFESLQTGPVDRAKIWDGYVLEGDVGYGSGNASASKMVKSLLLHTWHLDEPEVGFDSRLCHNNDLLEYTDFQDLKPVGHNCGQFTNLIAFGAPVTAYMPVKEELAGTEAIDTLGVPAGQGQIMVNPDSIPSFERASADGYLNSTDVRFRFTLPAKLSNHTAVSTHPMGQDHYEFRWIVFRNKRPTVNMYGAAPATLPDHHNMEAVREGRSFRNYSYDLFVGQTGRKRGFAGFTHNAKMDKYRFSGNSSEQFGTEWTEGERYSGYKLNESSGTPELSDSTILRDTTPYQEDGMTVDDMMTWRLNKDDYVIMKDVRFFLGKEHGKSHFEDTLHWDWNDPIDTPHYNMLTSPTLNDKNYRWHMMLIGTSGGGTPVELLSSIRLTTKAESG